MSRLEDLIQQLCSDGVEFKKLDDIGGFYSGLSGKSKEDFKDGNAKYISYMNVYTNPSVNLEIYDTVNVDDNEKQNKIQYRDVLFTGSSETPDECGITSVVTKPVNEDIYLNSFCFGYRLNDGEMFLPDFLKHLFRSTSLRKQIIRTANGVTRFNVSKEKMKKVLVPVPPIPVQCEIVRILDNFTELKAELKAELTAELTARKKQYEYYRDKLLTFYDNVEYKTLPEISENCDKQRKAVTKGKRKAGIYPYYGASGVVDYVDDYIFDGNYLLISEDGANLVARNTPIAFSVSGKNWINNHVHVLKFNSIDIQKFVEIYFNSIDLNKYISGGAQPKLNQDNLNKIPIPIPPLDKLSKIVKILLKFDTLCNDLTSGLPAEIEARKKQYEYYRDKLLSFKEKI